MPTPVGRDWNRLPPLEQSRRILAAVLDVRLRATDKYFVEAAGRVLKGGAWPIDAPQRATAYAAQFGWIADLFTQRQSPHVSLWDQLAKDLPEDPDYCAWVRNAAKHWLRYNDECTLRAITVAFAYEGHACTVEHADHWYRARPGLTGKYHETWIKQLEAKLGNKPISRLVKTELGDPPGKGERRGQRVQGGYIGDAATDVTAGDDRAAADLLDREDDGGDDPQDVCIRREQIERLDAAIEALPTDLRAVLTLRLLEGRTREEISASLGVSVVTVTQRLKAALKQLQLLLNSPSTEERS